VRLRHSFALLLLCAAELHAQFPAPEPATPTLTTRSNLVVIPTLVKDKSGAVVYSLQASDFKLTDDGVEQTLRLEEDTGGEPLALVVLIENGSDGARKLDEYAHLPTLVDNFIGAVPRRVAVVTFDGSPTLRQPFTDDPAAVSHALREINAGDRGGAILDGLRFSVELLRKQPANYRRAILLISETVDHGSQTSIEDAVRAVSDTNTAIFAVAFGSSRSTVNRELPKTLGSGPIPWLSTQGPVDPGPNHGCFSRDKNDPRVDPQEKPIEQTWDCLSLLAPPLRIAKAMYLAAAEGMHKNVPETVTHLTGGEYFLFHNQKSLDQELFTLANHVPNRYVLSFQPKNPHTGPHALSLTLPGRPQFTVTARETYWAEDAQN
jgi:von Willebrand factor type A domain